MDWHDVARMIKNGAIEVRHYEPKEIRQGMRIALTHMRQEAIMHFKNEPNWNIDKFLLESQ